VVAYYQKKFSDNNGNSKECILIIVKDKTPGANKIRIYMKGYYSPTARMITITEREQVLMMTL